ncbi:MAG: peptide chain release factor N(5)-glutamine methyltransferase [Candidatus Omnitrophica bacterium]|nr:peptide chain release factor N(5)-glutamine methyltransferase [Candidatus Omnitrophota bacterium]
MTEKELMLTAILECDRSNLYAQPTPLSAQQTEKLQDMEERRRRNEPLQYILRTTDFFGLKFKVDPRVLIPRPETELLVEKIIEFSSRQHGAQLRILDVGTGSGNIAIALAKSFIQARIVAMDISSDALNVARENARINCVNHQVDFVHCDFMEFAENYREAEKRFDIIVSNPPYIATPLLATLPLDVKEEPNLALDGGEDGLDFYRVLIGHAKYFLNDGGFLACEIADGQKKSLTQLLADNHFTNFTFYNDFRETPRFFLAQAI